MIEILCHSEPDALVLEFVGEARGAGRVLLSCLDAAMEADCPTIVVDFGASAALDAAMTSALREAATRLAARGKALRLRGTNLRQLNQLQEGPPPAVSTKRGDAVLGAVAARGGGLKPNSPPPRPQPILGSIG